MAIRLPILPARSLFYTPITIYVTAPGTTVDGEWVPGEVTTSTIAGSFQPPSPLREDITSAGDVGLGDRQLWTTYDLQFYDINSPVQSWVFRENVWWRIRDRHIWDPWVSIDLHVYALERYHKTTLYSPPLEP